MKGETCAIV
jgi:hypothetical protein